MNEDLELIYGLALAQLKERREVLMQAVAAIDAAADLVQSKWNLEVLTALMERGTDGQAQA